MAHDEGAPLTGRKRRRPRLPVGPRFEHSVGCGWTPDPEDRCTEGCEATAEAAARENDEETRT